MGICAGYRASGYRSDISEQEVSDAGSDADAQDLRRVSNGAVPTTHLILVDDERVRLRPDRAQLLHDAEDGRADGMAEGAKAEAAVRAGLGEEDVAREMRR